MRGAESLAAPQRGLAARRSACRPHGAPHTLLQAQRASRRQAARESRVLVRAAAKPPEEGAEPAGPPADVPPPAPAAGLALAALSSFALFPLGLGTGGVPPGGPAGGGGGDGGGGGAPHEAYALAANAEAEEEETESEYESDEESSDDDDDYSSDEERAAPPTKEELEEGKDINEAIAVGEDIHIGSVRIEGLPSGPGVPSRTAVMARLSCQPGTIVDRNRVERDVNRLFESGMFRTVNAKVIPDKKDPTTMHIVYRVSEKKHAELQTERVSLPGADSLPRAVRAELARKLKRYVGRPISQRTLGVVRDAVDGWYKRRGYDNSGIQKFGGLDDGELVARVNEVRVVGVDLATVDAKGRRTAPNVKSSYIWPAIKVSPGSLYNSSDIQDSFQGILALGLHEQVGCSSIGKDPKRPNDLTLTFELREAKAQNADVELEWGLDKGPKGVPALVSVVPGGTISYEHRNVNGAGASVGASVSTQNLWSPSADMSYRFMYTVPYYYGLDDSKRTLLKAECFNARRTCGTFLPGENSGEVPPLMVDRVGAKVSLTEHYSRRSMGSVGLVAQQASVVDEQGQLTGRAVRAGQRTPQELGPPTALSDSGQDRSVYAQAQLVRDTTYRVHGTQLGARDILTVDQGFGVGTASPLFNRWTASATRFLQLWKPPAGTKKAPGSLVLHGRGGMAVGTLPPYEAFLLGGPYSVRGYGIGELAACRRFAELSAELRLPVGPQRALYLFGEWGSDLGSSGEVKGNPTEWLRKMGGGSSLGAGLKLGGMRAEAIRDNNAGKWHVNFTYGERF